MYKVIIVDDEEIIVRGLKKVVDWAAYNCEVAATASDAVTGSAAIRTWRPDILFTDIRMPGADGLAMLAGLRSEFPDLLVTVLTGYTDFEYAQRAIRLGVCRLLLKPSHMDEINEALRFMTQKLSERFPEMEPPTNADKDSSVENANSFIVRNAVTVIQNRCTEKLSLQDVAETCYVSQWHLSKLLNKHTGKSFYDILNGVRIDEAKKLLADPSLRISDISGMVGYSDIGHFSRLFKKFTGMSANEYRNTLKF